MSQESPTPPNDDGLTDDELLDEAAIELPDREAMSVLRLNIDGVDNFAMPINEAFAMNIYTADSVAIADADQVVIIEQDATADE
jgi:hypothetical protein